MTPVAMHRETLAGPPALYAEACGEGPLLCLAHGFGGSGRNWRPQARALADRVRTLVFDLRGHARSGAPVERAAYAPSCFLDDFECVLRWGAALAGGPGGTGGGSEDRAVVGGLSMGAALALRFALERPERVRGLVLAAFPPGARSAPSPPGGRRASWAERFAEAIENEGLEAAGAVYAWGPEGGFDPRAAALVKAGFLEHPGYAIAHTLRELLAPQPPLEALRSALVACTHPALVIVGARDRLSLEPCRELAAMLPNAELLEVEGAGHVVNLEAREAVSGAIGAFLDGLGDRRVAS